MKKSFKKLVLVSFFVIAFSCNETEIKPNQVFENYLPETKEYKDELAKQLDTIDKSKLTYYFDSYEKIDGKDYLHVTIEGKNLKANTLLLVKNWDIALQPIKEFKGKGYGGAELVNLKFDIQQTPENTEFIYAGAEELLD